MDFFNDTIFISEADDLARLIAWQRKPTGTAGNLIAGIQNANGHLLGDFILSPDIIRTSHHLASLKWQAIIPHSNCPLTARLVQAISPSPPPILWVCGNTRLLNEPGIAVIGTRSPDSFGIKTVTAYVQAIAAQNERVIISGNAPGIDEIAHNVALQSNIGRTVAFVPTPPETTTPRFLMQGDRWLVVSMFSPGTATHPGNFLRRNRLVATMAHTALIGQTSHSGGTTDTMRHLRTLHRIVCVPTPNEQSRYAPAHKIITTDKAIHAVPALPSPEALQLLHTLTAPTPPTNRTEVQDELF